MTIKSVVISGSSETLLEVAELHLEMVQVIYYIVCIALGLLQGVDFPLKSNFKNSS